MSKQAYRTIVADPPWPEKHGRMFMPGTAEKPLPVAVWPYDRMSYEEIDALPVQAVVADKAHLYLWATQRSLVRAHQTAEAWGFDVKAVLTWCKPGLGMGFHYYRHSSEFVLFGARGKLETNTRNSGTWFRGKKGAHSAKPDEFFQMVEANSPGPRLELFARVIRPGWHVWGNEIDEARHPQRWTRALRKAA